MEIALPEKRKGGVTTAFSMLANSDHLKVKGCSQVKVPTSHTDG